MAGRSRRKGKSEKARTPPTNESGNSSGEEPAFKVTDKRAGTKSGNKPAETTQDNDDLDVVGGDLEELRARHEKVLDKLTRTQADFANFRRRTELESQELSKFATQSLMLETLRVLDGLERAFVALPADLRRLSWIDGIVIVHAQLRGILEAQGVGRIECKLGDPVDISVHEVVMSEDADGPMVVVEELQPGYKMHDRVIRPTLVRSGPEPKTDLEDTDSGVTEEVGEGGSEEPLDG